jgi:hypothetical protein
VSVSPHDRMGECSDTDADTFSHLFQHISADTGGGMCSGLQPVFVLLRIPMYMSLLCGTNSSFT